MSIVVCDSCSAYVDSDFDCDVFVEFGTMRAQTETKVWCEKCRDKYFLEQETEQDAADKACAEAQRREEEYDWEAALANPAGEGEV